MIHHVHEIAAEVIRQTGKDKPADAALREVLKSLRDLAPFDATEVAKTVFLYYRWHVWLREERGVESKMRLALRLDERFRANESNVPLADFSADDVMLAWSWNGEPISREHGGPLRVVIPKLYFWKSAKWIKRIEFSVLD